MGGKLILYHAWNDSIVPPYGTIDYFEQVSATMGQQRVHEGVRLFMTPGMEHCGGGSGPNQFGEVPDRKGDPDTNLATALHRWVEQEIAPERIVATKRRDDENPNSERTAVRVTTYRFTPPCTAPSCTG